MVQKSTFGSKFWKTFRCPIDLWEGVGGHNSTPNVFPHVKIASGCVLACLQACKIAHNRPFVGLKPLSKGVQKSTFGSKFWKIFRCPIDLQSGPGGHNTSPNAFPHVKIASGCVLARLQASKIAHNRPFVGLNYRGPQKSTKSGLKSKIVIQISSLSLKKLWKRFWHHFRSRI